MDKTTSEETLCCIKCGVERPAKFFNASGYCSECQKDGHIDPQPKEEELTGPTEWQQEMMYAERFGL